ncbi:MAG TPA: hypothetical protein VNN07_18780 [Candidatus Tectomicrobia bacterium]|nr:hypothetical protein [Candidatus Tectomicrobia bacterium]
MRRREALHAAVRTNRHVPQYLAGADEWEGAMPDTVAPGSREEAVICDEELGAAWRARPDALRWLRVNAPVRTSGKRRRR